MIRRELHSLCSGVTALVIGAGAVLSLRAESPASSYVLVQADPTAAPATDSAEAASEARQAYKSGNLAEARKLAEAALVDAPSDAKLKLLLGRILSEQKEFAAGQKLIKEVITAEPDLAYARDALGDSYFRERDFLRARDAYAEILRLKPNDPDATLKIIYSEIGRADYPAAGAGVAKLNQFDDSHPHYFLAKAALAQSAGRKAEAEQLLQMARTMYGNITFTRYLMQYLLLFPSAAAGPDDANKNGAITGKTESVQRAQAATPGKSAATNTAAVPEKTAKPKKKTPPTP